MLPFWALITGLDLNENSGNLFFAKGDIMETEPLSLSSIKACIADVSSANFFSQLNSFIDWRLGHKKGTQSH